MLSPEVIFVILQFFTEPSIEAHADRDPITIHDFNVFRQTLRIMFETVPKMTVYVNTRIFGTKQQGGIDLKHRLRSKIRKGKGPVLLLPSRLCLDFFLRILLRNQVSLVLGIFFLRMLRGGHLRPSANL